MLAELGVPAGLCGWDYLTDGIEMVMENPLLIREITKELYPSVAVKHNTEPSRVERGMRHAIERAWGRCHIHDQDKWFGSSVDPLRGKPTNTEFVAMIAKRLVLEEQEAAAVTAESEAKKYAT